MREWTERGGAVTGVGLGGRPDTLRVLPLSTRLVVQDQRQHNMYLEINYEKLNV